jgi:Mg2+ and Co2+ transporter CorA
LILQSNGAGLLPYDVIDSLKDLLEEYNRDTKGFHKAMLKSQQAELRKIEENERKAQD